VLDSIDYAAFIGRNPGNDNIYVHTGDSGQGITHGVAGAMINSALILGADAKWVEVYDPDRMIPWAVGNFLKENVTAVKNFAEYLAPGELSSLEDLKPGKGAIVREGLSKVAAYRDDSGRLFTRSAACTHLGCHLHSDSNSVWAVSSAPIARAQKIVIAAAISGNNSTSVNYSPLCGVLCGNQIQQHRPECRDSRRHIEHGPDHGR
jgi:Rieske Fe-S protein